MTYLIRTFAVSIDRGKISLLRPVPGLHLRLVAGAASHRQPGIARKARVGGRAPAQPEHRACPRYLAPVAAFGAEADLDGHGLILGCLLG
jgi:hypothetical protein